MLIKIKEYKVSKRGHRGMIVGLPPLFLKDNNVKPGDILEVFRTFIEGKDALIITIKQNNNNQLVKN